MSKKITNYWLEHYCTEHCTLCGNSGVLDTRATAVTAAGVWVGRLNYCICPNGQALRKHDVHLEDWDARRRK